MSNNVNLHTDVSTVGALTGGVKAIAIGVAAFGNAFGKLGSATEKGATYLDNAATMLVTRQEKADMLEIMQLDQDIADLKASFKAKANTDKATKP